MRLRVGGASDVGQVRGHNEDAWLSDDALGLHIVCDGMGGHAAGEVASHKTCEVLQTMVRERNPKDAAEAAEVLRLAVEEANRAIYAMGTEDKSKKGAGTTCTAILVRGGRAAMAHVGDSRLYLLRNGELHQLSRDHTFVAEAVRHGILTPEQALESEHGNIVTRAVGPQERVIVDTLIFDVLAGDTLLLCSDGLHSYFPKAAELRDRLGAELEGLAEGLVATANERGGDDNITALVVGARAEVPEPAADRARTTEVTANFAALRHILLFSELDMAELAHIASALETKSVAAGGMILSQGAMTDGLFVLVEGTAVVNRDGQEIARLEAGAHFGEMALLNQKARSASVLAQTDCRLLRLSRDAFCNAVQQNSIIGVKFLWRLAQTLSLRLDEAFQTPKEIQKTTMRFGLFPSPFQPPSS